VRSDLLQVRKHDLQPTDAFALPSTPQGTLEANIQKVDNVFQFAEAATEPEAVPKSLPA